MTSTPIATTQLGGLALRAFGNIAKFWILNDKEQARLLGQGDAKLQTWRLAAQAREPLSLPLETLERLGAILGIYKALMVLLPTDETRSAWLRSPNTSPIFEGRSALDRMSETDIRGILAVFQYLNAQMHG